MNEIEKAELSLAERMKSYEHKSSLQLAKKLPVVIRLDGCHFHTFTRGLKKPFDNCMANAMIDTTKALCENIHGCVFGYTQSDEITLILIDYQQENTQGWFDYKVQKMCSVAASMASRFFNQFFEKNAINYCKSKAYMDIEEKEALKKQYEIYNHKFNTADFDCRCFSLPPEEVVNCLIWRQQDGIRNSISAVGQKYFSAKELNSVSSANLLVKLKKEKHCDWNDIPLYLQRGTAVYRKPTTIKVKNHYEKNNVEEVIRNKWTIDKEIPLFVENKEFVNKYIIL